VDDAIGRIQIDVEHLTTHPDRVVGSAGHRAAREWAVDRFRMLGLSPFSDDVFELPYKWRGAHFANVAARIPAATASAAGDGGTEAGIGAIEAPPVVIGAHYDTVPGTPGADDNAASLAIIAEVAARLARRPASRPVVVVAFDAEEPPYFHGPGMGSARFVEDHVRDHVHAAIVLDLVAHAVPLPGLEDVVAFMGAESHPGWATVVRPVAERNGPVLTVPNDVMPDMSDHRAFRLAERPYLFLTCGQGPNYHGPADTIAHLDLAKAVAVADMVEAIVRDVAQVDMQGARPWDTSELDYELMRRFVTEEALAWFGVHAARDAKQGLMRLVAALQDARS
jgi:hypothetical protein